MPKKLPRAKQQGKPYTKEQREQIIKSLKPYLVLGYDLKNACIFAQVTYATVWEWVNKDPALLIQIQAWQSSVNAKARENIAKSIQSGSEQDSKWWLERREKEFSAKSVSIALPIDETNGNEKDDVDVILKRNGLI